MVEFHNNLEIVAHPTSHDLLLDGEVVALVDDSPEVLMILEHFLLYKDIPVVKASSAEEFYPLLNEHNIAAVLLDIELPGKKGTDILAELAPTHPDLGIIMVTGTTDIQTALDCLRLGADDYLTKPVSPEKFHHTINQTLKKRQLAIQNRQYQQQLQNTNSKMQFLHDLTLKMNSAYLNALELDNVLFAILTGITSEEGLRFNRAFLALFNDSGTALSGKLAIGPATREEAGHVWQDLKNKNLGLLDLLENIGPSSLNQDSLLNTTIQRLSVPISDEDHILIASCLNKQSMLVINGACDNQVVSDDLLALLGNENFIVVPLFSPDKSLGVIIADNFVTANPITRDDIMALEIFANQASLAIEHSNLYRNMAVKIEELERITIELDKNKDMLVQAERYSTIGYISAQMAHAFRNPITSIGGTANFLLRRDIDDSMRRYLEIIAEESCKIEKTLADLFDYVEDLTLEKSPTSLTGLLRDCLSSFYPALKRKNIILVQHLQEDIHLQLDSQKIRQVFLHLLRNSLESTEVDGRITVSLIIYPEDVIIEIADTGHGNIGNVEEIAANPLLTAKTYGTGLGFSLVKQILDLHNASLSIEKTDPVGTVVSISFPLSANK